MGALQEFIDFVRDAWELLLEWLRSKGYIGGAPGGAAAAAAAAAKQRRKKSKAKAKSAADAAAATSARAAWSESEESEEDDGGAALAPRPRGVVGVETPAGVDPGRWEPVGGAKRPAARLGAAGASAAVSRARGGRQAAAAQPKGEVYTCERPECGAAGHKGFRKCGRCKAVWYCTPACLASDHERHQNFCTK